MNRTSLLALSNGGTTDEQESNEAQLYFKDLYPDIEYIKETDSFLYRGETLDYFKSGVKLNWPSGLGGGLSGSYLLVDPDNYRYNWLFTYGDKEEMWEKFMEIKYLKKENIKGFIAKYFGRFLMFL